MMAGLAFRPTRLRSFMIAALLGGNVVQAALQCYYPNGTVNADSEPCNTSAEISACCGATDICLSNGYCLQQSGDFGNRIARGACTAQKWDSVACPQFCNTDSQYPSQALLLVADTMSGAFCCSAGLGNVAYNTTTNRCIVGTQGNTEPFSLPSGSAIYDRSTGAILSGTLNVSALANGNANHTGVVAPSGGNDTTDKGSDTAAVAAGIAVPLAVLLIAALIAVVVLWNRLRKAQSQLRDRDSNSSPPRDDPTRGTKEPLMQKYHTHQEPPPAFHAAVAPQPVTSYPYQQPIYEAGYAERNELPAQQEPKEVSNTPH